MDICRNYTELSKLLTYEDRYNYLRLNGNVGIETFGFDRYLNQYFYNSKLWQEVKADVVIRDKGCNMGLEGFDINGMVLVHHMNPIKLEDILQKSELILDPEYLISVSLATHNDIHYGRDLNIRSNRIPVQRSPHDQSPWRI